MKRKITLNTKPFNRVEVAGNVTEPLLSLDYANVRVTTLKSVMTSFRGNYTAVGRLLGVDRATVTKIYHENRLNVVMAFDAGDGKVIYKLLK